jgi:hypothetical protein
VESLFKSNNAKESITFISPVDALLGHFGSHSKRFRDHPLIRRAKTCEFEGSKFNAQSHDHRPSRWLEYALKGHCYWHPLRGYQLLTGALICGQVVRLMAIYLSVSLPRYWHP